MRLTAILFFASSMALPAHAGMKAVDVGIQEKSDTLSCRAIGNREGKVAAINVALNYNILGGLRLGSAPEYDLEFFQRMSQGFKPTRTASYTNGQMDAGGKAAFLEKIKSSMGDAKYVNFNFSGHGVILKDGESALLLPGGDFNLYMNCFGRSIKGGLQEGDPNYDCSKMENYFVRSSELKKVFADRKVFGILDNCHAGAFDLGNNSSMMMASQGDQKALQNSKRLGGDFTDKLKGMIDNPCDYKLPSNPSMYDIMSAIHEEKASTLPGPQVERVDNRAWTRCFVPKSKESKTCTRSFSEGQAAEVVQPVQATANGNPCNIPKGAAVRALEDKSGSRGAVLVRLQDEKIAADCGTSEVSVPIQAIQGSESQPKPVNPNGGAAPARR